jgi:PAS domain S-box-containing protein
MSEYDDTADRGIAARQDGPDTPSRAAALEGEIAMLRRTLARAGLLAERAGRVHEGELANERAGRAADAADARSAAVEAEARHGREIAAGQAHLAAVEADRDALRRANAALAESRAALRGHEARWRGLFESMREGVALCEMLPREDGGPPDFRYLEVNGAFERLTGLSAAAVVGRTVRETILGVEPVWVETFARVAETGEAATLVEQVAALGRWFEVTTYRTEPGRFAVLFTDVTERRRAEGRRSALVELGDRLRDLGDPAGIMEAAAEVVGRALGADRAGYGVVDADEATIHVGRHWSREASPSLAGDHRLDGYWTGFADALRRGEVVIIGDAAHDPRTAAHIGSYVALGVRACVHIPVVEAGRVVAVLFVHDASPRAWTPAEVGFVRGVAERVWAAAERARAEAALRDSERRLRATQDRAGVGIHEVDAEGHYARINETFTRMTGYRMEDFAGRAIWDFIEGEGDRREARETFARLVQGEIDSFTVERPYTNKQGRRWWAEVTTTAVHDEGGRFLYAVRVVHDITERKRAEQRRTLLLAELNHRVKNTLAVVQSLALQTARGAADLPSFSVAFQARLIALAGAHDLLSREHWERAALDAVVRAALDPLALDRDRVDLSGCASSIMLSPTAALDLTMALHELATNALKYGALSVPAGRVSIICPAASRDGAPVVEWIERGGPPVAGSPARRGFGLRLLGHGLTSKADIRFEPQGLRCTFRLPSPPSTGPDCRADGT